MTHGHFQQGAIVSLEGHGGVRRSLMVRRTFLGMRGEVPRGFLYGACPITCPSSTVAKGDTQRITA